MLRLLGDGKLYAADKLFQKNYKSYLDILKVIREEFEGTVIEYIFDDLQKTVSVVDKKTCATITVIDQIDFVTASKILLHHMRTERGASIEAPDSICRFANQILVTKPKAPAVKSLSKQFGGKNDIFLQVRDSQTSLVSVMGFASLPTLFNAGSSSQFLYRLTNCNDDHMKHFNSIRDANQKRGWTICKQYLASNDIHLIFAGTKNPLYTDNMVLIRDSMPLIMSYCVLDRLILSDSNYEVQETTERIAKANPLNVSKPDYFYEKSIKDFLMAGFTGMTAAREWDGREQVSGGYIVVTDNGDVLCYHAADREFFRDYLYKNTHFEYVDTNKYKWSYIEKINGEYYLPLNVSIRFNSNTRL